MSVTANAKEARGGGSHLKKLTSYSEEILYLQRIFSVSESTGLSALAAQTEISILDAVRDRADAEPNAVGLARKT